MYEFNSELEEKNALCIHCFGVLSRTDRNLSFYWISASMTPSLAKFTTCWWRTSFVPIKATLVHQWDSTCMLHGSMDKNGILKATKCSSITSLPPTIMMSGSCLSLKDWSTGNVQDKRFTFLLTCVLTCLLFVCRQNPVTNQALLDNQQSGVFGCDSLPTFDCSNAILCQYEDVHNEDLDLFSITMKICCPDSGNCCPAEYPWLNNVDGVPPTPPPTFS